MSRLPLVLVLLLMSLPAPAAGQFRLPGLEAETVLPLTQDPGDVIRANLEARQQEFDDRLDRRQTEFRWQLERLERRRTDLAEQTRAWRQRRSVLARAPERYETLTLLLERAVQLDELLRATEEAYDAQIQALIEASSHARQQQLDVDTPEGWLEDDITLREIDERMEDIDVQIAIRRSHIDELQERGRLLDASVQQHRQMLDEGRLALLDRELSERIELEPPEAPAPLPVDPDLVGPLPEIEGPPTPDPMPTLSPADEELLRLKDSLDRLEQRELERRCDLDRKQVELLAIDLDRQSLDVPLLSYHLSRWRERRSEAAAREGDGIFSATVGLIDRTSMELGAEHGRRLLADPTGALEQMQARIAAARRPGQAAGPGLMLALALLGVLAMVLAARSMPILAGVAITSRADALAVEVARAIAPVLPVTLVCAVLLMVDAIPTPLRPLYRFSALAPPLAGVVIAAAGVLFPKEGSDSITPSVARYLRGLIRAGAVLATAIGMSAAMLPLLGFPSGVGRLLQAALVLWLLVGWLGVLLRRKELLAVLGAEGPVGDVGVLRAGIRRFYRVFALGPVVVYLLYAMGYLNLARLLIRGGLVTLGVGLLAPWVYHRATLGLQSVVGFPDGGGWLALTSQGSKSAYRSLIPLLLLLVGGGSLLLLASGWDYGGNVFSNVAGVVHAPLFDIGGSRITGLSIGLFAFTIVVTIFVSRWIETLLGRNLYPLYELDTGMRATLDTLVRYCVFGFGLVIGLDVIGVGIGFLTVFAGVIGLAVGFGSQTLAANFIAGLILLLGQRVSVDDVIELDGLVGRVAKISAYATIVRTIDNLLVVIPNAKLIDSVVVNWTDEDTAVRFPVAVGVAYGSDVPLVRRLMLQAGMEDPRVLSKPQPAVRFDDFADSCLLFTINVWIDNPDLRLMVASDVRIRIDRLFREHDVEIAFPQRDLHLRGGDGAIRVALERGFEVRDEDGTVVVPAGKGG